MSERRKTHNGRDMSGHFKVKQADVDDLETDPNGTDFIRDDVRLGGAVADTGATAGQLGEHVGEPWKRIGRMSTGSPAAGRPAANGPVRHPTDQLPHAASPRPCAQCSSVSAQARRPLVHRTSPTPRGPR